VAGTPITLSGGTWNGAGVLTDNVIVAGATVLSGTAYYSAGTISVASAPIVTSTIGSADTGYSTGDVCSIAGGTGGYLTVLSTGTNGLILTYDISVPGTGNSVSTQNLSGGTGSNGSINITSVTPTLTGTASPYLYLQASCGLGLGAVALPFSVFIGATNSTITLTASLTATTLYVYGRSITFAGAYDITLTNFYASPNQTSNTTMTFVHGQNLNITGIINTASAKSTLTIASDSGGNAFNLNYSGLPANCQIATTAFTDCNASGSSFPLDDWCGTLNSGVTNINTPTMVTTHNILGTN
jgi:hypothetical protein